MFQMSNCSRLVAQTRAFSASSKAANKAVFIIGAARTPIGSFRSSLATVPAPQLAAEAMKATLQRSGVPAAAVQEVFLGQVIQANVGQAPARQATLAAGCDVSTAVTTINKVCSSGLKAVMLAAQQIQTGHQDVVFGGGMESMSQVPFYMPRGDSTYGGVTLFDGIVKDGLTDAYDNVHMGICGEKTASELGITREEQDAYAIQSYTRSAEAWKSGAIGPEVVPVNVKSRKGVTTVDKDEEFTKIDFEKMKKLKTVFKKDGTITAANASTLNDGACAVLLASEEAIKKHGMKPLARVLAYGDAATNPLDFAIAPPLLVPRMLKAAGLTINDIDHFECNEAFSVVAVAFQKKLNVDPAKLNPHGGAVSLGHPIGMSGARLITHLVHSLQKGQKGLAAICNGGGGSSGMIIEKL
ncbi:hypothetical protein PENTCL1PPCAC_4555 [Pristionchus entomophagus]|uniref:Uncharacterized protein n=1 Tax=Pristionchus entomophagus TaxID=358040 RepID=A0AAV5SQL9_9BILA|nr:hypothetical protein PENTCL1PPCAC_4555 [Pristionchus entomophagus]